MSTQKKVWKAHVAKQQRRARKMKMRVMQTGDEGEFVIFVRCAERKMKGMRDSIRMQESITCPSLYAVSAALDMLELGYYAAMDQLSQ